MPQLRDSGNHPISDTSGKAPTRSAEESGIAPGRPDRFDRIFGIETEYGVSVTGDDAPDDAGLVAMEMFAPVVSRTRSTNTYLGNGSRLYLDVGSHPEYATAEARDPGWRYVPRNVSVSGMGPTCMCICTRTTPIPPGIPSVATRTIWCAGMCR